MTLTVHGHARVRGRRDDDLLGAGLICKQNELGAGTLADGIRPLWDQVGDNPQAVTRAAAGQEIRPAAH